MTKMEFIWHLFPVFLYVRQIIEYRTVGVIANLTNISDERRTDLFARFNSFDVANNFVISEEPELEILDVILPVGQFPCVANQVDVIRWQN